MVNASWRLSAVEVRCFKSFTGRQWASFDIPDRFVGVLGPNGSGKSNLLEAICFAAGCGHSLIRGCRALKDVTSTDAGSQLSQVKLQLSHGQGNKTQHHLLETSLTPEGTRAYRLDGRIKTGAQIKDYLRSCGIVIDATTIIQQASVTRLTDSNNPATLAELVCVASGLNSWRQETAAARQEIIRTRKALQDIQNNISKLSAAASADEAAVQAGLDADRLQLELEILLRQLADGVQQHQMFLQQQAMLATQQQLQIQAAGREVDGKIQQLLNHKKQITTEQAQVLSEIETRSSTSITSKLAAEAAAAESRVAVLQAAQLNYSNITSQLTSCKQQLAQQESKVQQLAGLLKLRAQAAQERNSSLAAVKTAGSEVEDLQKQLLQMQKQLTALAGAVRQQRQAVSIRAQDVQQTQADVQAAAQTLQTLPAQPLSDALTDPVAAAAAEAVAAAADVHAQQQCVAELQQLVLQLQMDVQVSDSSLSSQQTTALLAACNHTDSRQSQPGDACAAPLHACFSFKVDASDQGQFAAYQAQLTALAIIAGPAVLQVLVADSVQDANQLLSAAAAAASCSRGGFGGAKMKIWPLDNLKTYSSAQAQRHAQQQLGRDKVIIPLDLFDYDRKYAPAMQRAFGGYVLAADDATAAKLVQQFGLSSVTLQGTVSKKGSMSGGWTGSFGSHAKQYWSTKLQHDALLAQLEATKHQLQQQLVEQHQLEATRLEAEQYLAAARQRKQALIELQGLKLAQATAEEKLHEEQQSLQEMETQYSELHARLKQCTQVVQDSGSDGSKAGSKAAAAAFRGQLEQDAARAAAAVMEAQEQLAIAQEQAEETSAQIETLDMQQHYMPDIQQIQQQLQEQVQDMQSIRKQLTDEKESVATFREQYASLQQEVAEYEQQLLELQKRQLNMHQSLQQAGRKAEQISADSKQLDRLKKHLIRGFSDYDVVHALGFKDSGGHAGHSTATQSVAGSRDEEGALTVTGLQQVMNRAKQLHDHISSLDVPDLPAAQQEACQSQLRQIADFKQQAAALESAAAGLESRILMNTEQVHAANDAVYEDIAAGFTQVCSTLLPALEVQLERTDSQAHQGLRFRFRRLKDTAATAHTSSHWQANLGQLSGGQQTLVSLAMLLAVARTGNSSRLFLLDEVDAALDEHNQERAAAFLKHLANAADGCCQILCVTHNAAFQQLCDGYVHVTRGADGGTMPATAMQAATAMTGDDSGQRPVVAKDKRNRSGNARYNETGLCNSAALVNKGTMKTGIMVKKRVNKKVRFDS